jgi:peptidoglycan/LPS O-acetylase OafA/YrhL
MFMVIGSHNRVGSSNSAALPAHGGSKRKDIEGLRAIAVLLVLLWHAGITQIPGGFVGVDVFFVVSGFLMTAILYREMTTSRRHRISISGFYARRARRLIPASTCTLAITAFAAWLILPVTRLWQTGWDIVSAGVYAVNWRLADQAVDYLAQGAAPSPVQHFWSLSVEEQYYVVWPLIIYAIGRAVLKLGKSPRALAAVTLSAVFTFSLAWSIVETTMSPGRAYFVTSTRIWQLALGGIVAISAPYFDRIPTVIAAGLAWFGVVMILGTGLFLTGDVPFPGWVALVPTLATGAVLACGPAAGAAGPVRLFGLGRRPKSPTELPYLQPFQLVGALSYSLYLWHWPFIVIGGYAITDGLREITLSEGLTLVALSAVPAWLSYCYVERPFREKDFFTESTRNSLVVALVGILVAATSGSLIMMARDARPDDAGAYRSQTTGVSGRGPEEEAKPFGAMVLGDTPRMSPAGRVTSRVDNISPDPAQGAFDTSPVYASKCHRDESQSDAAACTYGDPDADFTVALVGDSHAAQWVSALQYVAQQRHWRLKTYTKSACAFIAGTVYGRNGQPYDSCTQRNDAIRALMTGPDKPDLMVLTNTDYVLVDGGSMPNAMVTAWGPLIGMGVQVVVLADTPTSQYNVPECVSTHRDSLQDCATTRNVALAEQGQAQRQAAELAPEVQLIDLNDWICPGEECPAVIGDTLVYFDMNHLSATYSASLGPQLDKAIGPR